MTVAPEDLARTMLRRASAQIEAAERDRADTVTAVTRELRRLRQQLGFRRAWLIGSLAWGGFGVRSDIDVVIEGASEQDLMTVADAVGSATGRVVDALAFESLPEDFAARVLGEGRRVA